MWNANMGAAPMYQYTDVLYAPGYYNCYTLAVNLTGMCDASIGATFVASPNDPHETKCAAQRFTSILTFMLCASYPCLLRAQMAIT